MSVIDKEMQDEFIRRAYDPNLFDAAKLKLLSYCSTAEYCNNYLERPEIAGDPSLSNAIKQIRVRLNSTVFECDDDFDRECLVCLLNYEEVRRDVTKTKYVASRTRQSGKKSGWKQMVINAVTKKNAAEADGFQILKKFNRLEASFESFVIAHGDNFTSEVESIARQRLIDAGYLGKSV